MPSCRFSTLPVHKPKPNEPVLSVDNLGAFVRTSHKPVSGPRAKAEAKEEAIYLPARWLHDYLPIADKPTRIAAARRSVQHVIMARAYASHLWHETRSLRNSSAAR